MLQKSAPSPSAKSLSSLARGREDGNDDGDNSDWFRFPPLSGNILVVGDGDFSYSVALANENRVRGDAAITASSLDTKCDVEAKYSRGKSNINILDRDSNAVLVHGLDVTKPESQGTETNKDSHLGGRDCLS